jgi:hypothetical protein
VMVLEVLFEITQPGCDLRQSDPDGLHVPEHTRRTFGSV